jgi:hypothetical protein
VHQPLDDPTQRPTSAPWRFVPRHCPRPGCPAHKPESEGGAPFRFHRHGFFRRKAVPYRIPRFRCLVCERTFSTQTFSPTYWMKRPELLRPAAATLCNGQADRHVRRSVRANPDYPGLPNAGCAGSSVTRLVLRLATQAALFGADLEAGLRIVEPLAGDDFLTFSWMQLNAVSAATIVGCRSNYVYVVDLAQHLRGGRLTPAQRALADEFRARGFHARGARHQAWRRVLVGLLRRAPSGEPLELATDADTHIRDVLAGAPAGCLRHRVYPNPPRRPKGSPRSPAARERDDALRAVDQLHLWFRHSLAHHRRETVAFARSTSALLARLILFVLARNAIQAHTERRPDRGTPAMAVGLTSRPLDWDDILERRRFRALVPALPPAWEAALRSQIATLGGPVSKRRTPRFLYA